MAIDGTTWHATDARPILASHYRPAYNHVEVRRLNLDEYRVHLSQNEHPDDDCLLYGLACLATYREYHPDDPAELHYYATGANARAQACAYLVRYVSQITTAERPVVGIVTKDGHTTSTLLTVSEALDAFWSAWGRDELLKDGVSMYALNGYGYLVTDRLEMVQAQAAAIQAAQAERAKIKAEVRAELEREQQDRDVAAAVEAEHASAAGC
jgi:hypothetical protein